MCFNPSVSIHKAWTLRTAAHALLPHRSLPFSRCLHHLPTPGLHPCQQHLPDLHGERHLSNLTCVRVVDTSWHEGCDCCAAHHVCHVCCKPPLCIDIRWPGDILQLLLLSSCPSTSLTMEVYKSVWKSTSPALQWRRYRWNCRWRKCTPHGSEKC